MATLEQLEKRLIALEKAVQQLKELQAREDKSALPAAKEETTQDTECYFVPAKPAESVIRCQAVIEVFDKTRSGELGLSDAEWDSIRCLIELEEEKDLKL